MKRKTIEKAYHEIDMTSTYLHDIYYYLPYLSEEDCLRINRLFETTKKFRTKCMEKIDAPLIALKNYTEGKCSWERAGMMCDLHIWGLRKYCNDKNVDYNTLRIDEYYGVEGDDGIIKIKENWEKLDPNHTFQPIKYNGDSLFTKYPNLRDVSNNEDAYNDANENYIKYKGKMLISEYACKFYKKLNHLIKNNPECEEEVNFYLNECNFNKNLSELSVGLNITNEDELQYLELKLDMCKILLKENDLENILNSYYKLMDIMIKGYYDYTIDKSKIPSKESGYTFRDMIMNISKEF